MKKAFTMVELLVVIGVISVLACLVAPSIKIARARAQASSCLGNLKAIGVGLTGYLGDNQMTMPQLAAARASTDEQVAVLDNTLNRYVDDVRVFTCPAGQAIARTTGTSYFWNSVLSGQAVANLNMLGLVNDLSKIPVVLDKEGWHTYSADKVNQLYADGHAANELKMFTQ